MNALLHAGGDITADIASAAIDAFSLGALPATSDEAKLLRTAFTEAWPAAGHRQTLIETRYARFLETTRWVESWADGNPASANRVLAKNLEACTLGQRKDATSLSWAEYEWRRRQHFSLELLLSSVCGALDSLGGDGTPQEMIAEAKDETTRGTGLSTIWPMAGNAWERSAKEAAQSVPADLMLGTPLPFPAFTQLRPHEKMLAAFALIASLEQQTRGFRKLEPEARSISDLALQMIVDADDTPFEDALTALVMECAITPHLQVTLRKMSNGQKCSLRFFPDGEYLRLTDNKSGAGFSGSRLDNTLNILVDIGLMRRADNGSIARAEAA